ncbi:Hypothetical protein P11600040 [Erwinia phage phiEa116]|nr:Hypothetical protein P11600040 [Erwinia phage phiEa116]
MILGRFLENVLATLLVFVVVYHFEWMNPVSGKWNHILTVLSA